MDSLCLAALDLAAEQQSIFGVALAAVVGLTITLLLIDERKRNPDEAPAPQSPAPFGYGLTGLPVAFHDLSDQRTEDMAGQIAANGFALPLWATANQCGGCFHEFVPEGFLCERCCQIAGQSRVHQVFQLIEEGDEGGAWFLANALMKHVVHYRSVAANN